MAILHDLTDNCVSDRDACVDKLSASLAKDIKTLIKDVETVTQQINVSRPRPFDRYLIIGRSCLCYVIQFQARVE